MIGKNTETADLCWCGLTDSSWTAGCQHETELGPLYLGDNCVSFVGTLEVEAGLVPNMSRLLGVYFLWLKPCSALTQVERSLVLPQFDVTCFVGSCGRPYPIF